MILAHHLSNGLFLSFVVGIPCYAQYKKLPVLDTFLEGAKTGFQTTLNIVPYLVAILVAIGMLRASGFFMLLTQCLGGTLAKLGFPSELLPLALVRPFSSSAANGVMAELVHHEGGNALISKMAATLVGSTDTTLYIIAIYFGSIQIKDTRHAIPAGLIAEFAATVATVMVCRWLFV